MKLLKLLIIFFSLSSFAEAPVPQAPTKVAPIVTVQLEWETVEGAKGYEIEIKDETFQKSFKSKNGLFSVQIPLGEHQVRGRAQDRRGVYGAWSDYQSFSAVPQKVDLKSSTAKTPPIIKLKDYSAWVKLQWQPILGAKKYRFYLKDNHGKTLAVHETNSSTVAFKTRPGEYQYNVTAVYSGDIESEPCEYQPTLTISGRKLDPPEILNTKNEEQPRLFRAKADAQVLIKAKVEYSPYLGDKWDPISDSKVSGIFNANSLNKPGRYRVMFRSTLVGFADSEPVLKEFFIKPQEPDLEKSAAK